ncbi:MAG: hypothetical protein IJH11_01965 [Lachnospiraceae bacterium]|nr:hypothetical protein [Lachnospiraceae bacterium]
MSFKDQIAEDLDSVFLNLDEFGEEHKIEGSNVTVVMNNDQLETLKKGQILGLVEADVMIFAKVDDLPRDLDPGRLLNVDGREMIIIKAGRNMGLAEVALRQNRTG